MKLRSSKISEKISYNAIADIAQQAKGIDTYGYRSEFIRLVTMVELDN